MVREISLKTSKDLEIFRYKTRGMSVNDQAVYSVLVENASHGSFQVHDFGILKRRVGLTVSKLNASIDALVKRKLIVREGGNIRVVPEW